MTITAVAKRIIIQFVRDKRSLGLLIIAPLIVLTLIWLVLAGNEYEPKLAIDQLPKRVVEMLQQNINSDRLYQMTHTDAVHAFEQGDIDAFITLEQSNLVVWLEGSDPTANQSVLQIVRSITQTLSSETSVELSIEYYFGSLDLRLFDQVGAVLIGVLIFFFVFIIGGISFLRERTQGTLEKLLSTPIKRWEIVTGYLIGFGLFTILQSVIIVVFAVYVLNVWMIANIGQLLLVIVLIAMSALTLATLLSAFANNEFQMMQFIPIVIIPQVFFTGIFNLDTMDSWLQVLSKLMPLTYGADALQQMMIKGKSIFDVWPSVVMIVGFTFLFFILNIAALKKHRRL